MVFYSPKSCYKVDLTPRSKSNMALKRIERLTAFKGQEVKIFNFKADDFTFVIKNRESTLITFMHSEPQGGSLFKEKTVNIKQFDQRNFKIVEALQLENGYCRMIGIRGGEEVFIWEAPPALNPEKPEELLFEDMFPSQLADI